MTVNVMDKNIVGIFNKYKWNYQLFHIRSIPYKYFAFNTTFQNNKILPELII